MEWLALEVFLSSSSTSRALATTTTTHIHLFVALAVSLAVWKYAGWIRSEIFQVFFFYFFDWTSESWEKRGNRVMMAMLIDHHARINSPKKRFPQIKKTKTFSLSWLNTIIFLMVINHYTYIKPMISLQSPHRPSILEICPSFLEKWGRPPKMANFYDL